MYSTTCNCFHYIYLFQEIALSFNPSARILQPNDLTYPISYSINTTEIYIEDINSTQHTRITINSASEYYVSQYFVYICTYIYHRHWKQGTGGLKPIHFYKSAF